MKIVVFQSVLLSCSHFSFIKSVSIANWKPLSKGCYPFRVPVILLFSLTVGKVCEEKSIPSL